MPVFDRLLLVLVCFGCSPSLYYCHFAPQHHPPQISTAEVYQVDPGSAEGHNTHVSCYYYHILRSGEPVIPTHAAIMLKNDSKQSHRWTCVICHQNHPKDADYKTCEAASIHWRRAHAQPWAWTWCDRAAELKITTADLCFAVIGIRLEEEPLPAGAAFHMLLKSIPSQSCGVDKRLLKPPYSKTITPPSHPCERGLPWPSAQQQLSKSPPPVELASWRWELFFASVVCEGNLDVLAFMIHPHVNLEAYINSRKKWHAQAIHHLRRLQRCQRAVA